MKEFVKYRDIFKGLHGDLMEFADRISSILGCPITIEDANHHLLAYSTHDDTTDQARISTIIGRRVPEKVINSLWKDGVIPTLLKNDKPIIIHAIHDVGLGNRAAVSIRKHNDILGFIWALEVDKPFSDEDLTFLHFSAKEAKNQLQQLQMRKMKVEAGEQEFLWRLLSGYYQDEEEIHEQCKKRSLALPSDHSIIVFEFPEDISKEGERYISYMLSTSQKIKTLLTTIDHNKLIILSGNGHSHSLFSSIETFIPFFILEMEKRFGYTNILGAAGRTKKSLLQAMNSYEEALYTLDMKRIFPNETDSIIFYEELGMLQHFESFMKEKQHAYHPAIQKLQQYDTKNHTELLLTLRTFLEKDCNPNDSARFLHIHVNTLNYRLKRIAKIGGISLKNPYQKNAILLDLKLLHYSKNKK